LDFIEDMLRPERLHRAAHKGDIDQIKALVAEGYDVNAFDEVGHTPLHFAAQTEQFEVVQCLLDLGAHVDAYDVEKMSNTPLGEISSFCSCRMAQYLLDRGADPTIQGFMQLSAVDRARKRMDEEGKKVYELLKGTGNSRRD
jgi:ankyrin repeat protein